MTPIEAIVWVTGIVFGSLTISSVARSFAQASKTVQAAQKDVSKNVTEDNSQGE